MSTDTHQGSALEPWLKPLLAGLPGLSVIDAHTHIGEDLDGAVCEPEELIAALDPLGARAISFPLHVEGGYTRDNDAVIAAAAASSDRIVPFCRLDPRADPRREGARALAAGARGIKLHPRAEDFTLAHPGVEDVFALAHEHAVPVLIHAGRGIAPLGKDALRLAAKYPRATLILAHAAIADLAWIGDELADHPNVLFDTSWWIPTDLLALFATVPPGRILFASDIPYGLPALSAVITLRCAMQAGLNGFQISSVMGGQAGRLLAGDELADLGPAPGAANLEHDVLLDRAAALFLVGLGEVLAGGSEAEYAGLGRLALQVNRAHPRRALFDAAAEALDMAPVGPRGLGGLAVALAIVSTPSVPVP